MRDETAKRIERVRRERGLSQTALAGMIDTRPATISDIENGKRQVGRWLAPLARALGVTADYLIGLDETPQRVDAGELDRLSEDQRRVVMTLVGWLAES